MILFVPAPLKVVSSWKECHCIVMVPLHYPLFVRGPFHVVVCVELREEIAATFAHQLEKRITILFANFENETFFSLLEKILWIRLPRHRLTTSPICWRHKTSFRQFYNLSLFKTWERDSGREGVLGGLFKNIFNCVTLARLVTL